MTVSKVKRQLTSDNARCYARTTVPDSRKIKKDEAASRFAALATANGRRVSIAEREDC
jgi:hypothetical protein